MAEVSNQISKIDSEENNQKKTAAEASFKKLQPEEFYRHHIEKGIRPDGRSSLTSFRPVSISPDSISTAEGSAIVKQGETIIACGIKAEIAKPRTETPNQGYIVPNLELSPMCHSQFKPGPPSETAQVASYFINEVIQNSKIIDLEKLCIKPGKHVWAIYIDLICLNYDGNILDVSIKALCAALRSAKLPRIEIKDKSDEEGVIKIDENEEINVDIENRIAFPINNNIPYCCTIAVFDDDTLLIDPTEEEEKISHATVTVVVQIQEKGQCEICHLHKPGGMAISRDVLQKCQALAKKQARLIQKAIDAAVPVSEFTNK